MNSLIWKRLTEAEGEEDTGSEEGGDTEENPFAAAAGDEGGEEAAGEEEAGAEEGGGEEGDKETKKDAKSGDTAGGIPVTFNASGVKKYNKANFSSDKGVVKSINKDGVVVTTQPDGVDVLVNFDDITEIARKFFKKKK